jgi:hypothetical protein
MYYVETRADISEYANHRVICLVVIGSSFDSFADTEGAAGYTQEVNQLWSASKVGH